ncbi:olfactory receptor 5AR1-like [Eleutherodactylus coqui]|uniref:olfactory receptor 5AR1-like n=1 Tax=Eleutherodactylus coqui TaxID=57060 RepID=UPI0034633F05
MEQLNLTVSPRFILLGLSTDPQLKVIFFLIFLIMYLMTISGNLLLITVVRINPALHSPMYFFLTNLAIIDISYSSSVVPVLLRNTLAEDRSISFLGCATQMYVSLTLGGTECTLLAIMAYDRFAAICRPLHYNTIMNKTLCFYLAVGSLGVQLIDSILQVSITLQLSFCNCRNISNYFCEIPAFLRISCGDTVVNVLVVYVIAGIFIMCAFLLILISYAHIIFSILKMASSQGRQKSFSTCASHLTAVSLFYGTLMSMYLQPHSKKNCHYSNERDKLLPILYTAVIPMLNPFIYSVRNKDVKNTLINLLKSKLYHKSSGPKHLFPWAQISTNF